MPFQQLQETLKPRFVVDQILSSIQDGTLVAGERMPSEAKLAELTGVGRTSVREALAALRLMGVVETRVGSGSFIASLDGGREQTHAAGEIADRARPVVTASDHTCAQRRPARRCGGCGTSVTWPVSGRNTLSRLVSP